MLGQRKHCEICGVDVKEETATKRFDKYFCLDSHAEKFIEAKTPEKHDDSHGGKCC